MIDQTKQPIGSRSLKALRKAYGYQAAASQFHQNLNSYNTLETVGNLLSGARYAKPAMAKYEAALTYQAFAHQIATNDIYDKDKDGQISFDEMKQVMIRQARPMTDEEGIQGEKLSPDEQKLYEKIFNSLMKPLFKLYDRNHDGKISLVEGTASKLYLDNSTHWVGQVKKTDKPKRELGVTVLEKICLPSKLNGHISLLEWFSGQVVSPRLRPKTAARAVEQVTEHFQLEARAKQLGLA